MEWNYKQCGDSRTLVIDKGLKIFEDKYGSGILERISEYEHKGFVKIRDYKNINRIINKGIF